MHSTPETAQTRITALVRLDRRNGSQWATLLGCSRTALSDRLRGRTLWSLRDAQIVALILDLSLDDLVGQDDLPTDLVPVDAEPAELPDDGQLPGQAELIDLPTGGQL